MRDWHDPAAGQGAEYLRRATQIRTLWLPYGA
jgi:aldehyde dehydrogenase (NAD+)